jgi:hypothetical protein
MALDGKTLTLMSLGTRDHALFEVSPVLTNKLNGDPANDNPIQIELHDVSAERFQIAARRSAILAGGAFTPPDVAAATALQDAINNLHAEVVASANANTLIALTTELLNQYGASSSA